VHLHTHSEYSLLDGLSRLSALVARAKALDMPALGLTDHGALYGAIDFYTLCRDAGIKPIIGVETYVARNNRFDRDPRSEGHGKPWHLVLLAKDFTGYQNLVAMVTAAHLEGYYYRPRMDKDLLRERSQGLIALSACLQGELARAISDEGIDAACAVAEEHRGIFGDGNYYLELMSHGIPEQERVNEGVREVSRRTGVPLVVTNDIHYVHAEDAEAQDVMVCIQSGKTIDTPDRLKMIDNPELFMRTAAQMSELFPNDPEALENTLRIAEKVDLKLPLGELRLPHFEVPAGKTPEEQLRTLAEAGAIEKYGAITPELRERIDKELAIIAKTGYTGYILIVQDFIRFAHEQGILTAVRGSAGGSVVNYAIGMTDIDPLKYGLIFERFLNLERFTPPDIDVDFMGDRRDEVIQYVTQKYGADRVAQIGTFNTMLARAAVRDVARVLGMPYGEADRVAKTIPFGTDLTDSRRMSGELRDLEQEPHVQRLLDLAERVEGLVRSTGTHAAGVVISREPITQLVPLERSKGNVNALQTQYEDKQLEKLGVLKFDFLGLGNLTILEHALRLIEDKRGIKIRREDIPLDDQKTFELLGSGETTGMFQLESAGMRRYIRELKPDRVEDVMAMVALFRPGPMDYIPTYIRRKHGEEPVTYPHPTLEPVLKATYGVMVYQEDVMAVTQALAGFTLAEADVLCYAVRKKFRDKLDAQKVKFVSGAIRNGVHADVIEAVWKDFEPFARYGFNRAHAAIYGIIAYHTAYLKANYTTEYMTAVLSAEMGTPDRIAIAVAECRRMGLAVLPPDVNESELDFAFTPKGIRFGLGAVKNVGEGAAEAIVEARRAGAFGSLDDFCDRLDLQRMNKRVIESLIKSGACDEFGPRLWQLDRLDQVLETAQRGQRDRASGQVGLFEELGFSGQLHAKFIPGPNARFVDSPKEKLAWEKELLGIYLSAHPLNALAPRMKDVENLVALAELSEAGEDLVTIACVVTNARKHITKNKQLMMFAQVEDLTGSIEVTVFPRVYEATAPLWSTDEVLLVLARVEQRDEDPKLLCEHAVRFDDAGIEEIKRVADERRQFLAKRAKFTLRNGNGGASTAVQTGGAALPRRPSGPPGRDESVVPQAQRASSEIPRPPPMETGPADPSSLEEPPALVIRFREVLDYERSIALFQKIQEVLKDHVGVSQVVLELPRNGGGMRRVQTSFRAKPSKELAEAVAREVGGDVVEVVLPR
jgi:DNA polymerase-3 subunit alpha